MNKLRGRIMAALLLFASCLLPGASADCDWEDGELNIDLGGISFGHCGGHHGCDDDDGWSFDIWFGD